MAWRFCEPPLNSGTSRSAQVEEVGPINPLLVFVGDLEERFGPDLLLRGMPALLRLHPRTRLVIVGEGSLDAALLSYARYLQIDQAVRLAGSLSEEALTELIDASDLIVVPSRGITPWWPIQAAWSAGKAVVVTHDAAPTLTEHEKDALCVYPSEKSILGGIAQLLDDVEQRHRLGEAGRRKLAEQGGCLHARSKP